MKNKIILGMLFLLFAFGLTGCCMSHEWTETTCTTPKTCNKCGEIEGEVAEHIWTEATCSAPKTCSVCGETEGEALAHTLSEANYQQPATCSVCGEFEGEPLQADFTKHGLECNVELNQIYDAKIKCYDDEEMTTSPKLVFSNYNVFESDENHPAKEGYEWKTVDYIMFFYDENALNYGWRGNYACYENFYDVETNDDTMSSDEDGVYTFTVNYNGQDYEECCVYESTIDRMMFNNNGKSWTRAYTVHVLSPKGYDGVVYGIRNAQIEWSEEQYIYDLDNTDTFFFQFRNLDDVKIATDINSLSDEVAVKVVKHFRMSMLGYFDEETIGYFDADESMSINQNESNQFLAWAIDKYNTDRKSTLSKETTIAVAIDYLSGKLDVPDTLYVPTLDE